MCVQHEVELEQMSCFRLAKGIGSGSSAVKHARGVGDIMNHRVRGLTALFCCFCVMFHKIQYICCYIQSAARLQLRSCRNGSWQVLPSLQNMSFCSQASKHQWISSSSLRLSAWVGPCMRDWISPTSNLHWVCCGWQAHRIDNELAFHSPENDGCLKVDICAMH